MTEPKITLERAGDCMLTDPWASRMSELHEHRSYATQHADVQGQQWEQQALTVGVLWAVCRS